MAIWSRMSKFDDESTTFIIIKLFLMFNFSHFIGGFLYFLLFTTEIMPAAVIPLRKNCLEQFRDYQK